MEKRLLSLILALTLILGGLAPLEVFGAEGGGVQIVIDTEDEPIYYSEDDEPAKILDKITITVPVDSNTNEEKVLFAGGYFEIDLIEADERRPYETLTLEPGTYEDGEDVIHVDEEGNISLNGEDIGRVNPRLNGEVDDENNPLPLRVDFSTPLENGDFSEDTNILWDTNGKAGTIKGWTIRTSNGVSGYLNQVWLGDLAIFTRGSGITSIKSNGSRTIYVENEEKGKLEAVEKEQNLYNVTAKNIYNEVYSFETDVKYEVNTNGKGKEGTERKLNGVPADGYVTEIGEDFIEKNRGNVLKLGFKTGSVDKNSTSYSSVFGPDAFSTPFLAKKGDKIAFDWRAFIKYEDGKKNSSYYDDYEVYGFLVDEDDNHEIIMYGRGEVQPWTTNTFTITEDGEYRFRFVAGSYDNTNGGKLGATLHIDNIRLFKKSVTSKVVQFIAKNITYKNGNVNQLAHELIGDGEGEATRTVVITAGDLTDTENNTRIDTTVTATVNIELNKPPKVEIEDEDADRDEETGLITISKETDNMTPIEGSLSAEDPDGDDSEDVAYSILDGNITDEGYTKTTEKGGEVIIDENGNWSYSPKDDFTGEDQFTIRITDKDGGWTDVVIKVEIIESPKISFYREEGSPETYDTKKIASGKALGGANFPEVPTKEGYVFKDWYYKDGEEEEFTVDTIIVKDIDVYGKWEINKYSVTFNEQDGNETTTTVDHGETVTKPTDPTKTGHTFGGWYKEKNYNNLWDFDSDTVTKSTTLYAKWTINKYTVSFDSKDGSEVDPLTINYGTSLSGNMPTPTKEGYVFKGWNTKADGSGSQFTSSSKVTEDITVYAQWVKIGESDTSTEVKSGDSKEGKIEPKEDKEGKIIYRIVDGPDNGEATVDEKGDWNYESNDGFVGEDNFIIEIIYPNGDTELVPIKVVVKDPGTEETAKDTTKDGKVGTGESGVPADKEYSYEIGEEPEHGEAVVDENGEWTYTPDEDFDGKDEFTIVVKEKDKEDPIATIPVKIVKTEKNKPVEITPPEGIDNPGEYKLKNDSGPTNGTVEVDEDGKVTYRPNENFTGEDEFTLENDDGDQIIVKVIVKKAKERPTVTSTVYAPTTPTGITFEIKDPPGAENGEATVDENGDWTYTPNDDFDGGDEFTIVVKEDGEVAKEIPVKIVVTDKDEPVEIDMPGNVDVDNPTYTKVKEPQNGTVTIDNGKVTYTPNESYTGEDEFIIIVSVGDEDEVELVVVVIVQEPINEPEEVTGKVTSPEDSNDGTRYKKEEDKDTEKGGKVTIDEDGNWTYTPEQDFTGEDEFTVKIIDEDEEVIEEVVVKIIVTDEDDPTLAIIDKDGDEGANGEVPLDEDRLGKIGYEIIDGPTNGQADIDQDGNWEYTPKDGFGGEDEFTVKVTYPNGDIEIITIQVEVKIEVYIELTADPETIVANGKDKTDLTATVKDLLGNPVEGVEVEFTTEEGKFEASSNDDPKIYVGVTDENGVAIVTLISEKKTYDEGEEPKSVKIPVTAKVDDKENGLTGEQEIIMTFEPSSITGIVKDKDGKPIEGARVKLGGREYLTDSDGRYKIFIPEGDKKYEVEIIKEIEVGDEKVEVSFTQTTVVGEVSGEKEEAHNAKKTLTGIIITKEKDEQGNIVNKLAGKKDKDDSKETEKIAIIQVSKNGKGLDPDDGDAKKGEVDSDTGVFTVEDLEVDTKYEFLIVREIEIEKEDGTKETVELVIGKMAAELTEDGEVTFHEELIDPYGTITDSNGDILGGVELKLYYANTQRNIDKGRKPNTPVPQNHLGGIFDFPPNDNANPQTSTNITVYSDITGDHGNYGWMVPNHGDYYIIGTKSGYKTYDSRMDANSGSGTPGNYYIAVDNDIVKYDFTMDKVSFSSGSTTVAPPKEEPVEEITPEIIVEISTNQRNYLEGAEATQDIDYLNEGDEVTNVELVVTIPKGAEVVDPDGGTVEGNTIVWLIEEIGPGERGSKKPTIKLPQISTGEETLVIEVQLMKDGKPIGAPSFIEVAVFSNRYGNARHSRYILGYPDGEFKPDKQITRAEIATIFARILNLEDYVKNQVIYKDVGLDAWYAGAVEAVSRRGLFTGYEGGDFRPNESITRAELAVVIARYLNLADNQGIRENFKDIKGHWAEDYIGELSRNNVISGYSDGSFRPQDKLKRSEAVTMINRMLNRGPLRGLEATFPDVDIDHWANGDVEESTRSHEYYRDQDGSEIHVRTYEEKLNF
ncbi:MAG: Ig-like domain-containing protein [Tissierellaceae bacterium]